MRDRLLALVAVAQLALASSSDDTYYYSGWWIFFGILFLLAFGACFVYSIVYYGNNYHVHRSYFENRDANGNIVSYGYQTTLDADVDAGARPPGYGGHSAHYDRSYAPYSQRPGGPPQNRTGRFARV